MSPPALSVVLVTRAGWAAVARTVECLGQQTVADSIELILVSFADEIGDEPPAAAERLAGHRAVAAPGARSIADLRAVGARLAASPVVAFGEDHAFPLRDWAEALIARHEEPWAVVGPVVRNANPATTISWADFVLAYGPYAEGAAGGEVASAPGHNSSYKREVLERHDAELELELSAEWVFHGRLRDEGERVFVDPRAVIRHINFSKLRPFLRVSFQAARAGAATRADGWPAPRRIVYSAGSVVLPLLRMSRLLRGLSPEQHRRLPHRALPALFAGVVVDAAGQAVGFVDPTPDHANNVVADTELERLRYVTAGDAEALS